MALGDNNYDNNNKKYYEPTVYSPYKMSNTEGVDPSALSFSFFRNLLKVSISPMKQNTGDKIAFDHENAISVYLTHTKARMLASEIKNVMENSESTNNGGVPTGSDGLISFSNGKELGINSPCLIIRKIDANGNVLSSYVYQFKCAYHYSIRNFNESNSKHDRYFYDNIEVDQFLTLLDEYYRAMTGAIAYSIIDQQKYDTSRMNTKIESIAEKLGVSFKSNNTNYSNGGNSFFNNTTSSSSSAASSSSRHSTIEELQSKLED